LTSILDNCKALLNCLNVSSIQDFGELIFVLRDILDGIRHCNYRGMISTFPFLSACCSNLRLDLLESVSVIWKTARGAIVRTKDIYNLKMELKRITLEFDLISGLSLKGEVWW
jgi:hypothetical protein